MLDVIQNAADAGARPILDMITRILNSIAKKEDLSDDSDNELMDEGDDGSFDGSHFDDYDYGDFGIPTAVSGDNVDSNALRRCVFGDTSIMLV